MVSRYKKNVEMSEKKVKKETKTTDKKTEKTNTKKASTKSTKKVKEEGIDVTTEFNEKTVVEEVKEGNKSKNMKSEEKLKADDFDWSTF